MRDFKNIAISLLILLTIGLHAVPLVQRLDGKRQTLWPIMAWGMYRNSRGSEGPIRTSLRRIIGITSSGEELQIRPLDAGLSRFALRRMYTRPMYKGEASAAQRLADRLNRHRENPIMAFRLESKTYTITDTGIIEKENPPIIYQITR